MLTDAEGRPVAVHVYPGNTAGPKTVPDQVETLAKRFGLSRVVLVGDGASGWDLCYPDQRAGRTADGCQQRAVLQESCPGGTVVPVSQGDRSLGPPDSPPHGRPSAEALRLIRVCCSISADESDHDNRLTFDRGNRWEVVDSASSRSSGSVVSLSASVRKTHATPSPCNQPELLASARSRECRGQGDGKDRSQPDSRVAMTRLSIWPSWPASILV